MRRRQLVVGLVSAPAALAIAGEGMAMTGSVDIAHQVRDVVDQWAAAWNAADMDAMAALFSENAHWVNIVGMHWQGRAEVERAHRIYFELMFKGVPSTLEEVESIIPIPGGGAIVVARWAVGAFTTPAGIANPPSRDRMTLVLVRAGDRLVIAHGANIQIVEDAQKFDPVKSEAKDSAR